MNRNSRWLGLGLGVATIAAAASLVNAGDKHDKSASASAAVASVGQPAPTFTLKDTDGKTVNLADYKGQIVVLEWFNPECPVVVMHYKNNTMTNTIKSFEGQKVTWLAINSGAPGKQGHGADKNKAARKDWHMTAPVLLDETGEVGKLYGAKTTPHMFVIDAKGNLVYAGAIDDGNPGAAGKTNYVAQAVHELLKGETVSTSSTKPYGCSVKY